MTTGKTIALTIWTFVSKDMSLLFNVLSRPSHIQFSSVAQFCPTLCDPVNHRTAGLPVHHQHPEFTQTHVHRVSDAIQPSHPLLSPSPPAPNPSQHESFLVSQLFAWGGQSTGVSALASFLPKKSQSCPTLCDPIDGSPPGSPVPGILQARTLEWVAISFSNAWRWKVKVKSLSHVRLLVTPWTTAHQAPPSMGFSRPASWSGCHCSQAIQKYKNRQTDSVCVVCQFLDQIILIFTYFSPHFSFPPFFFSQKYTMLSN